MAELVNVSLRPLTSDDFDVVFTWSQDADFCRANGWNPHLTREEVGAWWTRVLTGVGADFVRFGVEADGRLVGYADLAHIERAVRRASFGIAIGARELWGRHIGREASRLMPRHGFHTLDLSRITAEVHAPNVRSVALMERLGFRREGVLRRHDLYNGAVVDVVLFGLLKHEFEADG